MATDHSTNPSFSRGRRWAIGFNVVVSVIMVLAVVVMVNYLSSRYFRRFHLSTNQRLALSPRTIGVLNTLTNQVDITFYYQKSNPLYGALVDLLKEYQGHTSKINVHFVDFIRDTANAEELKNKYNLGSATNVVIFASEGRLPMVIPDEALSEKELVPVASDDPNKLAFDRKMKAFLGEQRFTAALLAVTNPKPLKVYYLQGNGEHPLNDTHLSYANFFRILVEQNNLIPDTLVLSGTNGVPMDCNLLIAAGSVDPLPQSSLDQIDRYLNEGGRLLALFNFVGTNRETGLEKVLAKWGINVSKSVVVDSQFTTQESPYSDVVVLNFSKHPAVNPLTGRSVILSRPRMISKIDLPAPASDTIKVNEIAFTSHKAHLVTDPAQKEEQAPLMVAVEQNPPKDILSNNRGSTRIIAAGDSFFLTNVRIGLGANSEFAGFAANWLLERDVLLEGVGPQPVTVHQLLLTTDQMQTVKWILLAAIPGGVLLLGGLVWFRRRK
jgi:ABC-type uncharacterized transport system involved in gliding motility auxiliary subunit